MEYCGQDRWGVTGSHEVGVVADPLDGCSGFDIARGTGPRVVARRLGRLAGWLGGWVVRRASARWARPGRRRGEVITVAARPG